MRVRGFGVAPFFGHEQTALAQDSEQDIAPAGHALRPQPGGDFVQHFACAQARELGAHGPHRFEYLPGAHRLPGLALAALVEALPAHAVELATALHA